MVSPQQEEVLWVFDFVGQQEADGLQGLLPPIHIVTQEQVVAFWREAAILKQPQQIIVLPVDVTCGTESRHTHTHMHALRTKLSHMRLCFDLKLDLKLSQNLRFFEQCFSGNFRLFTHKIYNNLVYHKS